MKRMAYLLAIMLFCLAFLGIANAKPHEKFPWGSNLPGPASVGPPAGAKLVININHQVVNDPDSGFGGIYWAFDEYNRHIQVWQTETDTFYVDAKYIGSFTTFEGSVSPQNNVPLPAGIDGNMEGGYQAIITGTLKTDPTYKNKGNLGQFDYQGDASGNAPGVFKWVDAFFNSSYTFSYIWWGWEYRTSQHGTWVDQGDNNVANGTGDITP